MDNSNEKAALTGTALVNQSQADITEKPAETQAINPNRKALQSALVLAGNGVACFPCLPSKAPACPSGFKAATTEGDALLSLWMQYPAPLVGIATGAVSGFDALDIDPRHEGDKWLADNAANIPVTLTHSTLSGGLHLLFKHRAGIRNSASKIANGVDVRGDGGYIIWWPAKGLAVQNEGVLADWPEWLVQRLLPSPRQRVSPLPRTHYQRPYVEAAVNSAMQTVATATEGSRNHTLNSETYSLARFTENGDLNASEIAAAMSHAGLAAGLDRTEITKTIASALRARGV